MPVTKSNEKEKAHYLYFNTAKTQKEIAKLLNISERTMISWVKNGNWADLKKATYYSPEQETHFLYEELREIDNNIRQRKPGERFGTKLELEAKAKILSLITGPLKDTAEKWRNVIHEYAVEESTETTTESEPKKRGFNIIIDGIDPKGENYSNPDW